MAWWMASRRCHSVHSKERCHDRITLKRWHRIDVKDHRDQKFRHYKDQDQYRFCCDKGFFRRIKNLDTGSKAFIQLCHISCQKVIDRHQHFYGKDFNYRKQCPFKHSKFKCKIDCQSFQKHIQQFFNLRKTIHQQIIISFNLIASPFKFIRQLLHKQIHIFRKQIIFFQQWKLLRRQIIRRWL